MSQKRKEDKRPLPSPEKLLAWYDRHRRVLPWRALPGERPDPYRVWLSEMMLQQTTVAAVGPYYEKFLKKWPDLRALARADLDDVLRMWAGLGYYRRARFLLACAKKVAHENGGVFPKEEKELRVLPGLGPYTAAAMRAIAFDLRANVVDGNVERVVARLFAVRAPLPGAKKKLVALAEKMLPEERYGDYAQALMDLGATVCTPQNPKCQVCPWRRFCRALDLGDPQIFPRREKAKKKPVRRGMAFVAFDKRGAVFLRKRPEEGLLAGLMEVPSTPWLEKTLPDAAKAVAQAPFPARWRLLDGSVHHTFTHFDLELTVAVANVPRRVKGVWASPKDLDDQALPSVMRKVLRRAFRERKGEEHA